LTYITLDLQFFAGEKTEKATPKKKQDARKKGQVAKSADVNTAFIMLLVFIMLWFMGGTLQQQLLDVFRHSFQEYMLQELTINTVQTIFLELTYQSAMILGPIMIVAFIAAVAANYMQVGFLFSAEAIQMKLNKLNPIEGFKRIYSIRAIVELLKSLLKVTFVGFAAFSVIWYQMDGIMTLSRLSVGKAVSYIGQITLQMGLIASVLLIFLSVMDYLYQRFDHEKNLRMSKQDVKDEYKKSEGDPQIKSKIKEKQRQMAMQRMMQDVPNADVIITNPTHFAIAIKYDESKSDAPYVVAKGVDYVAQRIKQIAKENSVVTVENKPLARALYKEIEIGDRIPEDFFKAVAEILAYVYRLKRNA
jgi:flagellar biosynthesis protein FlhB